MKSLSAAMLAVTLLTPICLAESPSKTSSADAIETLQEFDQFSVDVGDLVAAFDKSHIASDPPILKASFYQMKTDAHVKVPVGTEAYLLIPEKRDNKYVGYRIIGRKPKGQPIKGSIYLLQRHPDQPRESVLAKFDFAVAANPVTKANDEDFYLAKGENFQRLWATEYAGSAMFRHLAMDSMSKIGKAAKPVGPGWPLRRNQGSDATIAMMAGGRAVSENLALDRELDNPENYLGELSDLSKVRGITVNAINWKPLLSKKETELDPLAKLVPHNQYAAFLPSFERLAEIIDRGNELARPLVQWFEPQSRATDVLGFYQSQLGLPLNALTQQVGKNLIGEVALTGSDPYFRTGTDIAVLMKSDQSQWLHQAIVAQVTAQAATHRNVKKVDHKVNGHVFTQWSNPTRHLSSFVAVHEDTVIVSNSLHQMMQILRCADESEKSMHGLQEFKFFRQRYARGSENAAALIVITDDAIRRWCGPQWRISASRRTRARATIADATMQHADVLLSGEASSDVVFHGESMLPNAGTLTLTSSGVHSKEYGTLDFQTPISEMNLQQATAKEVALYTTWRNRYERRWRRVFDPIAVQINLDKESLSADLTVIPLVVQSQYQQYVRIVGKERLKPTSGDHHEGALASFDMAVDTNATMFQFARMFLANQSPGVNVDPFAWVDGSASFYFDYDEAWMKRFEDRDPWDFDFQELFVDIPIAFHVPSKDSLRLTAFIVAVRSLLNQYAPNTIEWSSTEYKKKTYITATPVNGNGLDEARFHYITLPDGLTVSGNKSVIERAIDRFLERKKNAKVDVDRDDESVKETDAENSDPDPARLLAPQLAMKITGKGALAMLHSDFQGGLKRTHQIAWSNLPILNYFRQRYPDRDPFVVYETLFGQTLIEPSGGKYQWNDERGTFVSSNHGYHLEPKAGPAIAPALGPEDEISTTLSFQDGGLRAMLRIDNN